MRNWIAGAMTVLGTLLVLGGAGTIILRNWWKPAAPPAEPTTQSTFGATPAKPSRGGFMRLDEPDRLIFWGIVLLLLAAVAAGAIGFNLGANATAK
jgi:hypothetical protein